MSHIPQIDTLVTDAIAQRIWPGAVVLVSRRGTLAHAAAYGTTMYDDAGSLPVQLGTRYDIASLTKMFTATTALQCVSDGLLDLDAPITRYLPAFQGMGVTLRHLLTHTSGLAVRLSVLRAGGRAGILDAVYAAAPTTPPGSVVAYTNINSLLLGEIVAAVRDRSLDEVMQQGILGPLGLQHTGFTPPLALQSEIAPSEWDNDWRAGLVHGVVHDESAYALGGVAGHAGLFSTAHDILRFCETWCAGGAPVLAPRVTAWAVRNHTADLALACGLGWMLDRPHFMGDAPTGSYGHTGFTGPAMIVVPRYQTCIVVMTNRTYPRRQTPLHHGVIRTIVNTVLQ